LDMYLVTGGNTVVGTQIHYDFTDTEH
jgi:hypothetical protein